MSLGICSTSTNHEATPCYHQQATPCQLNCVQTQGTRARNNVSQAAFIILVACTYCCCLVDAQQLHIEHQGGVGGDHTAGTPLAVCKETQPQLVSVWRQSGAGERIESGAYDKACHMLVCGSLYRHGTAISSMLAHWHDLCIVGTPQALHTVQCLPTHAVLQHSMHYPWS